MDKKITQAQRLKWQMKATMHEAMGLLECSLMVYTMFQYECGLIYLETILKGDATAVRQLEESIHYWGWWKLHWHLREREWLDNKAAADMPETKMVIQEDGVLREMALPVGYSPVRAAMQNCNFYRRVYKIKIHNTWMLVNGCTQEGRKLDDSWCRDLAKELK